MYTLAAVVLLMAALAQAQCGRIVINETLSGQFLCYVVDGGSSSYSHSLSQGRRATSRADPASTLLKLSASGSS